MAVWEQLTMIILEGVETMLRVGMIWSILLLLCVMIIHEHK